MRNQRKHNNEKEMFALIKSSMTSGITRETFFKEHDISAPTYYYWYKKFMKSNNHPEDTFIPVVIPNSNNQPEQSISVSKKTELEIFYPNGVKVKLTQELDLQVVRSLVALI